MTDQATAGPARELTGDQASLVLEANAALAGAPVDPLAAVAALDLEVVEKWGPFLHASVRPIVFNMAMPQWAVDDASQKEFFDALGECLDQVLPGGPAGKYACWARLILASITIGGMGYLQHGGKFPPFGPKRLEQVADARAAA